MALRRSTTALAVTAGLLGGAVLLGTATLIAGAGESSPIELQEVSSAHDGLDGDAATSDDTADDVSGPCDEVEHADDPACAGAPATGAGTDDDDVSDDHGDEDDHASSTTTSTTTPAAMPDAPETRSLDAAGAGTVIYEFDGTTLALVRATPQDGWTVDVEQSSGDELDLDFRSGTKRVQVDVELEGGQPRERVRFRDDADGSEVRTEDGVVTRDETDDPDDDSSGPGSGDDDTADDDHSGPGGGDDADDDDDSSGHGGDDDDSSGSGSDDD